VKRKSQRPAARRTTAGKPSYVPPKNAAVASLQKDELLSIAAGKSPKAPAAKEELERRRRNRVARSAGNRRRRQEIEYPARDKPLAPTRLKLVLDAKAAPQARDLLGSMVFADLDAARTYALPDHVRTELADAIVAYVARQLRRIAHIRPFADVDVAPSQLDIGTRTARILASIPDGFLSEIDVASLFELPGFDTKVLLDLLSAVDVRESGPDAHRDRATAPDKSIRKRQNASAESIKTSGVRPRKKRRSDKGVRRVALPVSPWRPRAPQDSDPLVNDRGSFSLDMLTGVEAEIRDHPRSILRFWGDITADDLPPSVRALALGPAPTPDTILHALLSKDSIEFGRRALLDDLRASAQGWDAARRVELSLRRAGLLSEETPTLQQIGDELDLTRERVRQLLLSEDALLNAIKSPTPLVLSVAAWFALNARVPLTASALEEITSSPPTIRALRMVLRSKGYLHVYRGADFWVSTAAERRALTVLLDYLTAHDLEGLTWYTLETDISEALPGIGSALDLSRALPGVGRALDIGSGPRRVLVRGLAQESRSLVRKVVTFLRARAVPIKPVDLVAVMTAGYWPFEKMRGSAVDPQWLEDLARRHLDLLRVLDDGSIALPEGVSPEPIGHVGVLYRIVLDSGRPMRTQELCRRAAEFGINRNQVGMLVHSRRAPCLLPLARGLVGLVGRDEEMDPEHHADRPRAVRATPADNAGCFFFEQGWAVRLEVSGDLLAGGQWHVPEPLAEVLGFRGGAVRRVPPLDPSNEPLVVDGKVWKTHASSLSIALSRLQAAEGDLAFVVLRPSDYDIFLRRTSELDAKPLSSLLWSCGLNPQDRDNHSDPWRQLAKALGGAKSTRDDVASRLRRRGQTDLLALLDEATRDLTRSQNCAWPTKWFYRLRLTNDTSTYAVVAPTGDVRMAVGVVPEGTHVPASLLVTEGGLVWREPFATGATGVELPPKIAPTATSAGWVQWARAEHGARLAALAGKQWEIRVVERGWHVDSHRFASLVEALECVASDQDADTAPVGRSGRSYPRSALAFERAAGAAVARGLTAIRADAAECFVASFPAGVTDKGLTLLDALDSRGGS
jgi:hypothetical protein